MYRASPPRVNVTSPPPCTSSCVLFVRAHVVTYMCVCCCACVCTRRHVCVRVSLRVYVYTSCSLIMSRAHRLMRCRTNNLPCEDSPPRFRDVSPRARTRRLVFVCWTHAQNGGLPSRNGLVRHAYVYIFFLPALFLRDPARRTMLMLVFDWSGGVD